MITHVTIADKFDAKAIWSTFNSDDIWITICCRKGTPLANRSSKRVLVMKFDDIKVNPLTHNQARRLKNFILNHHINNPKPIKLLVNCRAGQSRSVAVGFFCKFNLGIPVEFLNLQFPNDGVMNALNVPFEHRAITLHM